MIRELVRSNQGRTFFLQWELGTTNQLEVISFTERMENILGKKLMYGALAVSGLLTMLQPLTGAVVHKMAASVFLLLCVGHMIACRKKLTGAGVALLALLLLAFASGVPALMQGGMAGAVHGVLGILCLCAMAAHGFARRRTLKSTERKQKS